MKLGQKTDAKMDIQVSPLIDVVFLLLIYFMITASLIGREGDLPFRLPTPGPIPMDMPLEVVIEIGADGSIDVDGMRFAAGERGLEGLTRQIRGLKRTAELQQSPCNVNISPHNNALHGRVVDVMDACAEAGVDHLGFCKTI